MAVIMYFSLYRSKGILTVEDAWVLPVRMCYRRDAISPINIEFIVFVRYILTVCLPVLDICAILYVINSVHVVLGSDFAI